MSPWGHQAVFAGAAFAAVAAVVPLVRRVALAYGVTDRPAPGKVHRSPTPYLGGLAIALVSLAATSLLPGWRAEAAVLVGAALAVGTVGLLDDLYTLMPAPRLLVEAVAASVAFAAGARVSVVGGVGDWALTVVWLVVLTNAFNLLDNMDGCSSVVGAVTGASLAVAAGLEGQELVGALAAAVAGACAGFLVHNWHPARIFMGDAGALFLGFLLAAVALKLRWPTGHGPGLAAVALIAGPAVFDTTLVVVSRLRDRRPFYVGGTDHTAHRLVRLGVPVAAVPVVLGLATAACGTLGVAVGRGVLAPWPVLAAAAAVGVALLGALLRVPPLTPARPGPVGAGGAVPGAAPEAAAGTPAGSHSAPPGATDATRDP